MAPRPRLLALTLTLALALGATACGGDDDDDGGAPTSTQATTAEETAPDLTSLPLGNQKFSNSPRRGYIYLCNEPMGGAPDAAGGPWIDEQAGTWNAEEKPVVPGQVEWPGQLEIGEGGEIRGISGNDLPDHATGTFPIPTDSKAYAYDQNPNEISAQTVALELPLNPTAAAEPQCMGGEAGIMTSGVALFNGFDANGADAVAHEVQDSCEGHPQVQGAYHYHSLSDCLGDNETGSGHSPLLGYALDGFGIYGHHGEDGEILTNKDLDECHGHTHEIEWNGGTVSMFHYHSTFEFPYVVGCFHGEPSALQVVQPTGGAGGAAPPGAPPEGAPAPPP